MIATLKSANMGSVRATRLSASPNRSDGIPIEEAPRIVRFATWLLGTAAFGFMLEGLLALIWADRHPGPVGVAYVVVLIAGARGLLGWSERVKARRER